MGLCFKFDCFSFPTSVSGLTNFCSFRDVYDVTVNFPQIYVDRLYESIRNVFGVHVSNVCSTLRSVADVERVRIEQLLYVYLQEWNNFRQSLEFINQLSGHLNQAVVKPAKINDSEFPMIHLDIALPDFSNDKIAVMELGCKMWSEHVVAPLQSDLTDTLLKLIERFVYVLY